MTAKLASFRFTESELTINWDDGRKSQLAAIWLRDHCQMPQSRDLVSGQRLIDITDIPADIKIASVSQTDDALVIGFAPDSHQSVFRFSWLLDHCYCLNLAVDDRSEAGKTLWSKMSFGDGLPCCDYQQFCDAPDSKQSALQSFQDYGFVILTHVPCDEGQVLKVIDQFGFVRETNYGALFEVRATVDANNLAFTNLGLGCHLDNPYRDPVPGIQLLHCLQSSTEGGESILQDGFMAANVLRNENPKHFKTLSQQWVNYRFEDANTRLQARVPMIEVNDKNEVIKVRYNNRSIATLSMAPDRVTEFYAAYRHYAEIIQRDALQIQFKLHPGELMMFDNTRVMHARNAYSKGGVRHLQGAYSDLDGLYSRLNILKRR